MELLHTRWYLNCCILVIEDIIKLDNGYIYMITTEVQE